VACRVVAGAGARRRRGVVVAAIRSRGLRGRRRTRPPAVAGVGHAAVLLRPPAAHPVVGVRRRAPAPGVSAIVHLGPRRRTERRRRRDVAATRSRRAGGGRLERCPHAPPALRRLPPLWPPRRDRLRGRQPSALVVVRGGGRRRPGRHRPGPRRTTGGHRPTKSPPAAWCRVRDRPTSPNRHTEPETGEPPGCSLVRHRREWRDRRSRHNPGRQP
jgi:hypothetical protein